MVAGASLAATGTADAAGPAVAYGWSAVIHHPTSATDNKATLRMISPDGNKVTVVGQVSDGARIQDVSSDGTHVITSFVTATGATRFAFWDTRTHTASYLQLGGRFWQAAYVPGGILTWVGADDNVPTTPMVYKRTMSGVATARFSASKDSGFSVFGDGSKFIETTSGKITVRSSATGTVLSTQSSACKPMQEWSTTSFAVTCWETGIGEGRSYSLPYNGVGGKSQIAPGGSNVMATSPTLGVDTQNQLRVTRNGTTWSSLADGRKITNAYPIAGWGRTAVLAAGQTANGTFTLLKYDIPTAGFTTLAGSWRGGVITDAQTIDGHH